MPKQNKLYWVDAFTDKVFSGNPAAVIPLEAWPEDSLLQSIAFENGLAETAYFTSSGSGQFHIRWFTPTAEVDLCGHATLATAFVIRHCLSYGEPQVSFKSRSGPLTVNLLDDGKLELDFPSRPPVVMDPTDAFIEGLGAVPTLFARAEANLALFGSANEVLSLRPRYEVLATLPQYGTIVTAPGLDCDFVSRFFAPRVGVPEDPVTGSAHCVLIPFWADRLGKDRLFARQLSERRGDLWCELRGDRVRMAGHAVLYLEGSIYV